MPLATGELLQDRYRIIAHLGQGGMGAVYRAWDTRLDVAVALKEMIPQPGLDARTLAQLRRQFQQEARVLARLNHPHLVRVTDFFQERGNAYLVMDFVRGESLAEHIRQAATLSESQVLAWTEQLLDALAYCHSQGVIHRDIKPHNVIIRSDGSAVLVDFGLVKLWDPRDPRTMSVMRGMGTPEYAPPEQYDLTGHTDARSDVYSLGATVYHALTGQAPPTATQRSASREIFQPPRALNKDISPETESAVVKALALTVADRFQTVWEMAAALKKASERGERTRLIPGRRTQSPWTRRVGAVPIWMWGVGGTAAMGILALILGVVLAWSGGAAEATPTVEAADVVSTAPTVRAETATVTPSVDEATATRGRVLTSTGTPTGAPTLTPKRTVTSQPSRSPVATATATPTLRPSSTSEPRPTATAAPSAVAPQLVAPAAGGTYQSPVTFEWRGSLRTGQAYQVSARHGEGGSVLQSDPIVEQRWTASLPDDKYGEWIWSVAVVHNGEVVTASPEQSFWFNPHPGGGDGGGDGDHASPEPTATR